MWESSYVCWREPVSGEEYSHGLLAAARKCSAANACLTIAIAIRVSNVKPRLNRGDGEESRRAPVEELAGSLIARKASRL